MAKKKQKPQEEPESGLRTVSLAELVEETNAPKRKGREESVEIVDGPPIPAKRAGRRRIYDFEAMEVGQSFSVPREEAPNVRPLASYYKKKLNNRLKAQGLPETVNFMSQTEGDKVRFWRLS